jgi:hypothetical protein
MARGESKKGALSALTASRKFGMLRKKSKLPHPKTIKPTNRMELAKTRKNAEPNGVISAIGRV